MILSPPFYYLMIPSTTYGGNQIRLRLEFPVENRSLELHSMHCLVIFNKCDRMMIK